MASVSPSIVMEAQMLTRVCVRALARVGVPTEDAALIADSLVRSECEGAVSHGVARLPALLQRIQAGVVVPHAELEVVHETRTIAVLDAHHCVPHVAASRGMRMALRKAAQTGLGAVTVRNGGNLGRAGHWALLAAEQGAIGIAASNASPRVVPKAGMLPILGNNPWAVALPTGEDPVVIDMANSIVAAGKIRAAKAEGRSIPSDWATDAEGNPTTDADSALAGALLAFGGHKGWAISLIVDALTGVLSGGAFGDDVSPPDDMTRPQCSAHFFLALQVREFLPLEDFQGRMKELARRLRASSDQPVRLPGENSALSRTERLSQGVPLRASAVRAIDDVLEKIGLTGWDAVLESEARGD